MVEMDLHSNTRGYALCHKEKVSPHSSVPWSFYYILMIGLAIAKQLARDGAKVMISSRKQEKVNEAVLQLEKEEKGCSVKGVVCHVAKAEHRKNLIEQTLHHFGGIDILVSNAAANPVFGPILQTPEEGWDKIFDVNVKSAFLLAKDIIPLMEKKGGGSVIFISSIGAFRPLE
ncbi:PREDICTED: dehydrogenase/reductase SDR family member 4-like, partial [Acropora digitifera]|uniref:dehydrogenase/reductase SDR family member 4-like n=1 Tax=Acropora digitifera TaxID=70779 RepID=UPI00077B17EB